MYLRLIVNKDKDANRYDNYVFSLTPKRRLLLSATRTVNMPAGISLIALSNNNNRFEITKSDHELLS